MADTLDLESSARNGRGGSNPLLATRICRSWKRYTPCLANEEQPWISRLASVPWGVRFES